MKQEVLEKKAKKEKDTPWTNTGIKVDLCSFLTRHVLFEKYNSQKAKETEMRNFFLSKIDGCELFTNSEYTGSVFYTKTNKENRSILMWKHEKNREIYINYNEIWSVFESLYMLQYNEIQLLTQGYLLDSLNSKGYKTNNTILFQNEPF